MSDEIEQVPTVEGGGAPEPATTNDQSMSLNDQLDDGLSEALAEIRAREPDRGESGRFQPKVVAQGAPEGVQVPGLSQAATPEPALPAIEAPRSWSDDEKKEWPSLPRSVQEVLARREGETTAKISTDGERIKALSAFEEAVAPYQELYQSANVPAPKYVSELMRTAREIGNDPYRAAAFIVNRHGIDLNVLAQQLSGQRPMGQQPDPNSALFSKIQSLESRLAEREQADQQARLSDATQRIEQFKKDRPHFDDATDLMDKFIRSGAAKGLEDAYDMAIHASPDIRAKIEAETKAAADKKAADEAAEKAKKDARVAPFAKRPGSTPTAPSRSKDPWDTMRTIQQEIRARQ